MMRAVAGGYPETLRLAHYISTFTSPEMTCLRSHILNSYRCNGVRGRGYTQGSFGVDIYMKILSKNGNELLLLAMKEIRI